VSTPRKIAILVGSARKPHSTSESLAEYLASNLSLRGAEPQVFRVAESARDSSLDILTAVDQADALMIVTPLYMDSLPYLLTATLEQIAQRRNATAAGRRGLACLVHCGFPEALHNEIAIAICRQFAKEAGFEWLGGLSLGGGAVIAGKPLAELGGVLRNVRRSLALTADALAAGQPLPDAAVKLMAKPLINRWVYTLIGNFGWKHMARKLGARRKLNDQPYRRTDDNA